MKILLNLQIILSNENKYNATVKPRADINTLFERKGYRVINKIIISYRNPKLTMARIIKFYFSLAIKAKKGDEWYFQYPMNCHPKWMPLLFKIFKLKGSSVTLIIHDVESVRRKDEAWFKQERKTLNAADYLFVHTPNMKNFLEKKGITTPMKVMYLFNYLTDDALPNSDEMRNKKNEIVFAGNLKKSLFIPNLLQQEFQNVTFKFYGVHPGFSLDKKPFVYCGKFSPENVSYIQGGWGLVWDGDSIDTCNGELGDYLRYNSSHKLSLYLSAGIPVIVWKESGLAEWIVNQNIGIAISSLKELDRVIPTITDEQYKIICRKVEQTAIQVRSGEFLYRLL